jgi:hypothetical protein
MKTYVGLNFSGLLRLLTIYMKYNFNTRFDSITNVEQPINKMPFYPFIVSNNLTDLQGL